MNSGAPAAAALSGGAPVRSAGGGRPAWWRSIRAAMPALGAFLTLRVISSMSYAACVGLLGRYGGRTLFTPEDSGWYRLIALHGYDAPLGRRYHGSVYGFFPLYPALLRYGADVSGLTVDQVGLAVTWLAALATAWALFVLGARLRSPRVGVLLACLWALAPAAVTESVMYADTLAIALSAWALVMLLRRAWLTAGVLGLLAGLARPTSAVVALLVLIAAAVEVWRRQATWRSRLAGAVAPLGFLGFMGYVAERGGTVKAYVVAQREGWGNHPDYGVSTFQHLYAGLGFTGDPVYRSAAAVISTAVILAVPVLIGLQLRQRQPWQLVVYTLMITAMVYGDDHFYTTTPREVLPLFPLLLVPATALARIRGRVVPVGLLLLAVAAGWYACYVPIMTGPVP